MNAPIVLCHYGNSSYLPYVFEALAYTNPDKKIFLLGDASNRWIGEIDGVEHRLFEELEYGDELTTFDQVYKLVKGETGSHIKKGRDWVNFVFKRWFYVYNFLESIGGGAFWHFDSDNMVLDSLHRHEYKFDQFDFTEQCNGSCMNGFVSSTEFVRLYLEKINQLFQDAAYLDDLEKDFRRNTDHAFTEMAAYVAFRGDSRSGAVNPIRLNSVIEGSTFDDCICQEHGMEMEVFPNSKRIKLIACTGDGRFFCFPEGTSSAVQMNSINLSWVPTELFAVVLRQLRNGPPGDRALSPQDLRGLPTLTDLFCREYRFKAFVLHAKRRLRSVTSRK